ncbi:MAG: serine/threonine-protein phosphatase [Deltaproteobacteria bacterium]|nr:serine/threonine-protein phosphatase [Deltaproteobacteria bacterium]
MSDQAAGDRPESKDAQELGPNGSAQRGQAPQPIAVRVFGCTDVGQIREHNEDNFLVADLTAGRRGVEGDGAAEGERRIDVGRGGVLLAVCDGMGGAAAGEIASQLAVDTLYERMMASTGHQDRDRLAMDIVTSLEAAGGRILLESNQNRACRGMGTTATVAALVDDLLLLGQVGDSRGYVLRGDRLVQVTRDQSLVNQLIEAGQLTEEEAENFEHSNIILQALGTADAVQVDLTCVRLRRGDVLMLCSDGLSGMVRDDDIRGAMATASSPQEACEALVQAANDAGGHDNITVVTAVFEGDGLQEASPQDIQEIGYAKYTLPTWAASEDGERITPPAIVAPPEARGESPPVDDTPTIEIHGEIEFDPEAGWDALLPEEAPHIPTNRPSWSVAWVVAALLGLALIGYLLLQ